MDAEATEARRMIAEIRENARLMQRDIRAAQRRLVWVAVLLVIAAALLLVT